jgi:hypothetical protein
MATLRQVLAQLHEQRKQLTSQLNGLDTAIQALSGLSGSGIQRRGRRHMSTAGRARIVAAQRARWARWKKRKKT